MNDKVKYLRQFISPFIGGENADALIATLSDQAQRMEDLTIAVTDQLSISTASESYLDKKLAAKGITRPPDLGMSDYSFRQMGIDINASKQVTEIVHTVLDTFYGAEAVRAYTQCSISEPYDLSEVSLNGMDLDLEFEKGEKITISFSSSDFENPSEATAQEISSAITRHLRNLDMNGFASVENDTETGKNYVKIFGSAKGPYSMVKVLGGRLQSVLEFHSMRNTDVFNDIGDSVTWEITRNFGSTIRFRWYSGVRPLLDKVLQGDSVLIYGSNFQSIDQNLSGTYTITNVRPATDSPTYDSGWFEVDISSLTNLSSSTPDVSPPLNNINQTFTYTIIQNNYPELKFFKPVKSTSYSKKRFSLAFEPTGKNLKIYLPASTKIVERELIGGAHVHMLYPSDNLNGTFGSSTIQEDKIIVVSDRSFKYRQYGYDNIGYGGEAVIDSNTSTIDSVFRENGFTNVILNSEHNLISQWSPTNPYQEGDGVKHGNVFYYANESSVGVEPIEDAPLWTSTAFFSVGQMCKFSNSYYVSLIANNTNNNPSTSPLNWSTHSLPVWTTDWPNKTITSNKMAAILVDKVSFDDSDNKFFGPYIWDNTVKYTLSDLSTETKEEIVSGESKKTILVKGAVPNEEGLILLDLNTDTQEGPIRYFSSQIPNSTAPIAISSISQNGTSVTVITVSPHQAVTGSTVTISSTSNFNGNYVVTSVISQNSYTFQKLPSAVLFEGSGNSVTQEDGIVSTVVLDPSYRFMYDHKAGSSVSLVSDSAAYVPSIDGSDYNAYITGTSDGRIFCQQIIESIVALGIGLEIIIVYPSDFGLGNMGGSDSENEPPTSDKLYVWGG